MLPQGPTWDAILLGCHTAALDVAPRSEVGRDSAGLSQRGGQGAGLDAAPRSDVGCKSAGLSHYGGQGLGLDVAPRSDVGRDSAGLTQRGGQGSSADYTTASISEANSYVNNAMVQPICAVMRTPIRGRRKRFLSAPSPCSTVKKTEK